MHCFALVSFSHGFCRMCGVKFVCIASACSFGVSVSLMQLKNSDMKRLRGTLGPPAPRITPTFTTTSIPTTPTTTLTTTPTTTFIPTVRNMSVAGNLLHVVVGLPLQRGGFLAEAFIHLLYYACPHMQITLVGTTTGEDQRFSHNWGDKSRRHYFFSNGVD